MRDSGLCSENSAFHLLTDCECDELRRMLHKPDSFKKTIWCIRFKGVSDNVEKEIDGMMRVFFLNK